MSTRLELAERCEQATGPDKRLDVQIYILLDPDAQHIVGEKPGRFPREAIYGPRSSFWDWAMDAAKEPPVFGAIPPFTASIDAAKTMVPPGWAVQLEDWPAHPDGDTPGSANARLLECTLGTSFKGKRPYGYGGGRRVEASAATLALAICAAALRIETRK